MLTYQGVIGLSVDLILMAVPVSHATLVIAIFLFFATRILRNRLPTVMAKDKPLTVRMALQVGFDGVGRKTKFIRDPLITHTDGGIEIDPVHGFVSHSISPF